MPKIRSFEEGEKLAREMYPGLNDEAAGELGLDLYMESLTSYQVFALDGRRDYERGSYSSWNFNKRIKAAGESMEAAMKLAIQEALSVAAEEGSDGVYLRMCHYSEEPGVITVEVEYSPMIFLKPGEVAPSRGGE